MRLIGRDRASRRRQAPRIAITEAEITADLDYPSARRPAPPRARPAARLSAVETGRQAGRRPARRNF